jgi:DNA repair exonuclease SbcCD ATPase subunit
MSELRDAAQDLLDYYDRLAAKFGRIAEYKAVKVKVDRLRKALDNPTEDDVENILDNIGEVNKMLNGEQQAEKTIAEIDEVLGGGADEFIWPPGKTRAESIKKLLDDYQHQHDLRQKYEAQVRELNERQERLETGNGMLEEELTGTREQLGKYKSSYETCDRERGVIHRDLGDLKKTVLYLQVLLPQLKEQGDVTSVGWVEGALDEGEQPHTSPEAEERLAKIKELVEASNEEKTDDVL